MTGEEGHLQRIPIGEQLGYLEYPVTADKLRRFRDAVEYQDATFPSIAAREYLEVMTRKYGASSTNGAISIRHADHYFRPPCPGRRIQVTGWVRDKHQSPSTNRLRVETFAVDEIGTEILRSEHTFQFGVGRGAERQGRRTALLRRTDGLEFLPRVEKRVTEESIERFEEARHFILAGARAGTGVTMPLPVNIHTGAELARAMGLARAVVPGELSIAYLHELLDRSFGIDFRQGGRLNVDFLRPAYAGDILTAQGLVTEKEPVNGRVNWRLQVWLANQRGERTAAGEAWVTVPSPRT